MFCPFNFLFERSLRYYYVDYNEKTLITSSNINKLKYKFQSKNYGEFRDSEGRLSVAPFLGMFRSPEDRYNSAYLYIKLAIKLIKDHGYPIPKITDFSSESFWILSKENDYYLDEIKFILKEIDPYLSSDELRYSLMNIAYFYSNFPIIFQHLKDNNIDVRLLKGVEGCESFTHCVLDNRSFGVSIKQDFFKFFYEKNQIIFDNILEDILVSQPNLLITLKEYKEIDEIIYKERKDFINLTNLQSIILNKNSVDSFSELVNPRDLKIAYNDLIARGLLNTAENLRNKFSMEGIIFDVNLVCERMYYNFRSLVELKKFPALAQLMKRHSLPINDLKESISNEFEYKADFNKYFTQFSPSDFKEIFFKMMSLAKREVVTKLADGRCNPKLEWLVARLFDKSLTHDFDIELLNFIKQVAPNSKMITSFENKQDVMNLTLGRILQKFNEEFSYEVMALHGHAPTSNFKHNQPIFRGISAVKEDIEIFEEFKESEQPYSNFKTVTTDDANKINVFSKEHNSGQLSTVPNYFIGKPFENKLDLYSNDKNYPFTSSNINLEAMQQGGIYVSLSEKVSAFFAGGLLIEYVMPKNELTMCWHSLYEVEMVPSTIKHENIRASYSVNRNTSSVEIVKVLVNPNFYVKGENSLPIYKVGDVIHIQPTFDKHEDIMRIHMDQYKCHEFRERFKGFDDFYNKFSLKNLEADRENMHSLLKESDAYQSICDSNFEYL